MPVVLLPSVLVAQLLLAGQLLVLLVPLLVSLMLPLPPVTQPLLQSALLLHSAILLRSAMLHPPLLLLHLLLLLLWAEA